MKYDFDQSIDRNGTCSEKWEPQILEERFGTADLLPLWVADMDFAVAKPIQEALAARAAHPIYGYTARPDAYYDAIIDWQRRRHGWEISKDWICYTPGVVPAICHAIQALTSPGAKILIQEPVYYPFRRTIETAGRRVASSGLVWRDGRYEMDFEDLERQLSDHEVELMILCSPHNPVGRVWTREELLRVGQLCIQNSVIVVSDEIHNDLIMPGQKHTTFASLGDLFAGMSVICTSVSKTFNLAGLQSSSIIIPNKAIRDKYAFQLKLHGVGEQNPFGIAATIAACQEGEEWLEQAVDYIWGNYQALCGILAQRMPEAVAAPLEGTYLAWINLSAYQPDPHKLEETVIHTAKVALDGGTWFGKGGEGWLRVNLACPRALVEEAARRICHAFGK